MSGERKVIEEPKWPPFNPFVRQPTTTLGKVLMLGFGLVLVPIRLLGAIATCSIGLCWCYLCSLGCDASKPYTPFRKSLLTGGLGILSRVLLFFYGYVWIKVEYEVDDAQERAKQRLDASLVVVNHIGFAELIYLIWSDGCCFVSKAANRNLPFIGKIAKLLQCIFVDRVGGDEGGGKSTTEKILERAHSPPGTWPPLCVCPEGTTTTGHCLVKFATGAFRAGLPVQPVIVSSPFYPTFGYDPSFSATNIVFHILGLMTRPMNQLHVKHLAVYTPNEAEKADPKLYANNVRKVMAKAMGVHSYELTWIDKLRFESTEKLRAFGRKKLAERHGGVEPPMPKFTQDPFGNSLESSKDK